MDSQVWPSAPCGLLPQQGPSWLPWKVRNCFRANLYTCSLGFLLLAWLLPVSAGESCVLWVQHGRTFQYMMIVKESGLIKRSKLKPTHPASPRQPRDSELMSLRSQSPLVPLPTLPSGAPSLLLSSHQGLRPSLLSHSSNAEKH